MNYFQSGVDINRANQFTDHIFGKTQQSKNSRILSSIGGFNAQFDISQFPVANPVLVSSTDGVGTKLKLALLCKKLDTIGIDLVAMVVNDIIVSGAQPLFFLDYYVCGQLNIKHSTQIIDGILVGCQEAEMDLVGGETAEMPLLYSGNDFDLAGFGIGIIDKEKIIKPELINNGDILIGIMSSGPHANGFSLINKIFDTLDEVLIEALLKPTKIYTRVVKELLKEIDIHGIAHITGGGIIDNVPRILPDYFSALLDINSWVRPEIFQVIQDAAKIDKTQMLRTFNCGIGLVLAVDPEDVSRTLEIIHNNNEAGMVIGQVVKDHQQKSRLIF